MNAGAKISSEWKYTAEKMKEIEANMSSSDCAEDFSLTEALTGWVQPASKTVSQQNLFSKPQWTASVEGGDDINASNENQIPLSTLEDGEILDWFVSYLKTLSKL